MVEFSGALSGLARLKYANKSSKLLLVHLLFQAIGHQRLVAVFDLFDIFFSIEFHELATLNLQREPLGILGRDYTSQCATISREHRFGSERLTNDQAWVHHVRHELFQKLPRPLPVMSGPTSMP